MVTVLGVGLGTGLAACDSGSGPRAVDREPVPTDPATTDDTRPDTGPDDPDDPFATTTTTTPDSDTPDTGTTPPGGDRLDWGPCDDDVADDALECATLAVPVDHDDPGDPGEPGDTIELALVRLPATSSRMGAVLFNPGGPGGSGVDYVAALATYASGALGLANFDLVGFDPRGVDRSNGLRCLDDDEFDEMLFDRIDADDTDDTVDGEPDGDPDDGSDGDDGGPVTGSLDDERFAEACLAAFGDTLQHYSTVATARDMDLVREALGDDTISYIGISYGTYLGAVYASLFPDRVRAFVLDSAFEPTGDTIEQRYLTQLVGFEEAFDAWAADCQADPGCAFGADDVAARWDGLRARLDDQPIAHHDGRAGDASVMETATVAGLYDPLTWPRLAGALAAADGGDPSGMFELADLYVGRSSDGTYSTIQQSGTIIRCASGFTSEEPDDPEAFAELVRDTAPRFAADVDADSFGDRCADLVPPVELPELSYDGDAPIVVIGGTNDPATPYRWAEEMTAKLGPRATLVTWDGEGHGQLFGSDCLGDVAGRLIVDLEPPAEGTVCEPDPPVERPALWDVVPVPDGVSDPLPDDALLLLGLPPRLVYGEARTSTLDPESLLDAYDDALVDAGFTSFGREEPITGLVMATYFTSSFEVVAVLVLTDEAYDDDELAPAARLVDEGETLLAIVHFPT